MDNDWIEVKTFDTPLKSVYIYIHKTEEIAKLHFVELDDYDYHDGYSIYKRDKIISIELALALVYPDKKALSTIAYNTKGNYSDIFQALEIKSDGQDGIR